MNYITVEKNNSRHYELLLGLMLEYVAETDQHQNITTPKEIIFKITKSMIDKLNEDRILKIVDLEDGVAGFCYAKIDRAGDRGQIRADWGYIMEFYVSPLYRRRGIGRKMVSACEEFFARKNAQNVWLTADEVTGIPFWLSCGYCDSGEVSSENHQKIFTKTLYL